MLFSCQLMATNEVFFGEPKIKHIQCFPNPATTNINFNVLVSDKGYVLSIYNFIGNKIEEIKISNITNNISLENYHRGIYIYQLKNKQGQIIESGKFQVNK